MGAARLNLELKARDTDPERSLATCKNLGAEDHGILLQKDTYFHVTRGRLKLRRQNDGNAQLIAYERPNLTGRRESHYRIVEVNDVSELEAALAGVLDIAAVVKKTRRLFVFDGVRIHLDQVEGLGRFIEFEGVASENGSLARYEDLLSDLRKSFVIEDSDLLAESYCDLILAAMQI
jgi:adenylate cyclase class 2